MLTSWVVRGAKFDVSITQPDLESSNYFFFGLIKVFAVLVKCGILQEDSYRNSEVCKYRGFLQKGLSLNAINTHLFLPFAMHNLVNYAIASTL